MLNLAVLGLVALALGPISAGHLRARGSPAWRGLAGVSVLVAVVLAIGAAQRVDVRKVVAQALMPMGLLWLALLAATADRVWRRDRLGARVVGAIAALLTISASPQVAAALSRSLEADIPLDDGTSRVDAVLVLGGGTSIGRTGPELNGSGARILLGAQLWHAGRTPLLVTSGASIPTLDTPRVLADETAEMWRSLGVPADAIVRLRSPKLINTEAEIAAFHDLVQARGWQRVGLVTSAWHMRRALRICRVEGVTVVPLATDWHGTHAGVEGLLGLPQVSALEKVEQSLWEYLGALKYGVR